MDRLITMSFVLLLVLMLAVSSWAQCPEDTVDRGECDTLHIICVDCEGDTVTDDFHLVRFPLLVTHDQTQPSDSISVFVLPFTFTHSNPAAYCILSDYWNTTSMLWVSPDFSTRSIFRHITEASDTLYHNRMAQLDGDFSGRGWDLVILDLDESSHFRLAMYPSGIEDQRWWESERVLLATMTFKVQDTMQICIDTSFWHPASHGYFRRSDNEAYVPRHNLPRCFEVDFAFAPDFATDATPDWQEVRAGDSIDYDVILTSLYGFSSPCTLTVGGLPPDASGSFDPKPVVPSDTAVMTIRTLTTTPVGDYPLTITATEIGGTQIEHSTDVLLSVFHQVPPCPEDTADPGECDTLHVICYDCDRDTTDRGPYLVRFPILVTHDQTRWTDSLGAFVIPLAYTHTNPSAYCSLSYYWNEIWMLWIYPDFSTRSIFRHIVEGSDTLYHNRFAHMGADFSGREWDTVILDLDGTSHFWMMGFATGSRDQFWWEGERVLLATMTFRVQDSMHICLDTTFWPPGGNLVFVPLGGQHYVPRDNLPTCFWVGPRPDFAMEIQPERRKVLAGNSISYEVMLSSLHDFASPCTLTVDNLPASASGSFDPNPITPSDTSVLTVQTYETTAPGIYDLTVTATELGGAGIQHDAQALLLVAVAERLRITAYPSVDLVVTDPAGDSVGLDFNTIEDGSQYVGVDMDGDGDPDDEVVIPFALVGQYKIRVMREDAATDADRFSLAAQVDGNAEVFLASSAPVPPAGQEANYAYENLPYLRGDANRDGATSAGDLVFILNYLFRSGEAPVPIELGDANCDGTVDAGDAVYLLNSLFKGGSPPCS